MLGTPEPVSPCDCDCDHEKRLFIQSHSASGRDGSYQRGHAYLCHRCGQFSVYQQQNDEIMLVEFDLPTRELWMAAGQYCRLLEKE